MFKVKVKSPSAGTGTVQTPTKQATKSPTSVQQKKAPKSAVKPAPKSASRDNSAFVASATKKKAKPAAAGIVTTPPTSASAQLNVSPSRQRSTSARIRAHLSPQTRNMSEQPPVLSASTRGVKGSFGTEFLDPNINIRFDDNGNLIEDEEHS